MNSGIGLTFHLVIGKLFTVNSEILARILYSQIALKDIFGTFKIGDQGMICRH